MASLGLANDDNDDATRLGEAEERNKRVVTTLYEVFNNSKSSESAQLLVAPYVEWWYHGQPRHQHLIKRLLTGSAPSSLSSPLFPLSIAAFGSTVVAEGCYEAGAVSWVHAWTLSGHGIVTHVREYYNTSVTVTRLHVPGSSRRNSNSQCVWQSELSDESSVPGLVLAL